MYLATYGTFDLHATSSVAALEISVTFVQETRELGVFISVLFRKNGMTSFSKSLFFVLSKASAAALNQLRLPNGNYMVQAYDLEYTGEISIGQPADQEMVTVTGADPKSKLIAYLVCTVMIYGSLPYYLWFTMLPSTLVYL